ncbi:MerR family transcriptional regulator [Nocardiopsis sp. NPDC006938]|uniref:MerR family transcriptional regulator n=1 Tax=Nocardiopsis sp. NPDC006938 TaxID=3364337 RepID=UPI0036C53A0E
MDNDTLYSIGDAARRSGLSVSAVRFYADTDTVPPTHLTDAGHRLYDVDTIARLELVRTLRELDTDLNGIRRLLKGHTTLHDLLTTHLEIVLDQERVLRARTAVLRTLIKQGATPTRADLMHQLVTMTDEERERIIEDFWNDVAHGLDVPDGFVDRLRTMRPHLPEDPTPTQLQAWIELADLVRDPAFRDAVRTYLHQTYSTGVGRDIASPPFQHFMYESGVPLVEEVLAAHRAGEHPRSARAQRAVIALMEAAMELSEAPLTPEARNRQAEGFRLIPELERQIAEEDAQSTDPVYDHTHGRYLDLMALINDTPPDEDTLPYAWIADAMSAPEPHQP